MAEEEKEEEVAPPEPYVRGENDYLERPQKVWRRNPKFTVNVHEEKEEE